MDHQRKVTYGFSHEVNINVRLTVGILEGLNAEAGYKMLLDDPYRRYQHMHQSDNVDFCVTCRVVSGEQSLCAPVRTARRILFKDWR
ncbi:hypothetical protein SARC_11164 [Sphaeroforma arctica JP610]|uniref:Uncharacterized protein n=1 Tax=Sphaeroforma arctica JP610 TaxID=667725 RepID=A0A0L0FJW3_9EUKA|nr:hypothetical protein SARC_11164 [Sphaeroforma arctica JP610]KNC76328.1 hypothetical protein SARC_11164 [Sphaeroforma arctica JP610]|eukprot:XP_014150230.1 hypothetical protein SARC_11164 [Sphaeroforma arctica JP610]